MLYGATALWVQALEIVYEHFGGSLDSFDPVDRGILIRTHFASSSSANTLSALASIAPSDSLNPAIVNSGLIAAAFIHASAVSKSTPSTPLRNTSTDIPPRSSGTSSQQSAAYRQLAATSGVCIFANSKGRFSFASRAR